MTVFLLSDCLFTCYQGNATSGCNFIKPRKGFGPTYTQLYFQRDLDQCMDMTINLDVPIYLFLCALMEVCALRVLLSL